MFMEGPFLGSLSGRCCLKMFIVMMRIWERINQEI
jgi:hypothetical protein